MPSREQFIQQDIQYQEAMSWLDQQHVHRQRLGETRPDYTLLERILLLKDQFEERLEEAISGPA